MNRKERTVKILKRSIAAAVFILPCLIYYFITKKNAGASLLYTAPFLWVVAGISLAAALFSYIILRKSAPEDYEEVPEERDCFSELSSSPEPFTPQELAEYPEFAEISMPEEDAEYSYASDIARAINAQKATGAAKSVAESAADTDFVWDETAKSEELPEGINELYENIPDTLPEGYSVANDCTEEPEFRGGYRVKRSRLGDTLLSKALCVTVSLLISAGLALLFSDSITKESENGYFDGTEYTWQDIKTVTVSEKILGSLSIEVTANDGNKTELFPATLIKGEKFSEKYDSIYAYMAHAVREMRKCGADVKTKDEGSITAAYKDTEDGSWKYISEIIGVKEK